MLRTVYFIIIQLLPKLHSVSVVVMLSILIFKNVSLVRALRGHRLGYRLGYLFILIYGRRTRIPRRAQ